MISERQFSSRYSSLWKNVCPMSERFVRRLNLETVRYAEPFDPQCGKNLNGLVNELAVVLCHENIDDKPESEAEYINALDRCLEYIELVVSRPVDLCDDDRAHVRRDAFHLKHRLATFYRTVLRSNQIQTSPTFEGCGILRSCAGDSIVKDTLIEIKAGERDFRSIDLRQLFVYMALNFASERYTIRNICLVNPRVGKYWIKPVKDVFPKIAGASESEVLSDLVECFTERDLSH